MWNVTADELTRLIPCNGSRLMTNFVPIVETDNTVRNEGDAADWIVRQVVGGHFTALELVERRAENGVYITGKMIEDLNDYLTMVTTRRVEIETDTSHAGEGWRVGGRSDAIEYDPATFTLHVNDLKFGYSLIEPEMNWPMISHAIGWLSRPNAPVVLNIVFTIWQPRPYHHDGKVRSWPIDRAKLDALRAQMHSILSNPTNLLVTGPQCRKCDRATACPAFTAAQMNCIDVAAQAVVDNISNDELSFRLDQLKRAGEVIKQAKDAFDDLAHHRIREGQTVKNYSLQTELANRSWMDGTSPEWLFALSHKDASKKELVTPAQAEKAGVHPLVVAAFTERRNKGAKLVRQDASVKASKLFNPTTKRK